MVAVAVTEVWCVLLGSSLKLEGIDGMDLLTYHFAWSIGFKCPMLPWILWNLFGQGNLMPVFIKESYLSLPLLDLQENRISWETGRFCFDLYTILKSVSCKNIVKYDWCVWCVYSLCLLWNVCIVIFVENFILLSFKK